MSRWVSKSVSQWVRESVRQWISEPVTYKDATHPKTIPSDKILILQSWELIYAQILMVIFIFRREGTSAANQVCSSFTAADKDVFMWENECLCECFVQMNVCLKDHTGLPMRDARLLNYFPSLRSLNRSGIFFTLEKRASFLGNSVHKEIMNSPWTDFSFWAENRERIGKGWDPYAFAIPSFFNLSRFSPLAYPYYQGLTEKFVRRKGGARGEYGDKR